MGLSDFGSMEMTSKTSWGGKQTSLHVIYPLQRDM